MKMHIFIFISEGSDFTSVAVEIIFGAGETIASVRVTILNGKEILEPPETFSVLLKSNEPDAIVGDKLANITILNKNGESC